MEPRIQYAKTRDRVNIAYAVFGTGPLIVFPSGVFGDVHMNLYSPIQRPAASVSLNEELVNLGWQIARYDGRGSGASDRMVTDFSLEARLLDLDAVVAACGAGRFVLCGSVQGGPTSIAYASRQPERVSHLVVINTFTNTSDYYDMIPAMRIARDMKHMAEDQWEFYTLSIANAVGGHQDAAIAAQVAAAIRSGMTVEDYVSYVDAAERIDVRGLLSSISAPTLAIAGGRTLPSGFQGLRALTRRLAPEIANARFVETDDPARVINEFLREGGLVPSPSSAMPHPTFTDRRGEREAAHTGMIAILFADIADSTALTERLGDAAFRAKARELGGSLRALIRECAGTPVEGPTLGDGVLAVFTSARESIEAARRCGKAGDDAGLPLHLGLHAGDVSREKDPDGRDNVYGGAVNIASRISGISAPGEVLVSDTVRGLARTSAGVVFEDRGEQALKGVGEPVRVWAVVGAE